VVLRVPEWRRRSLSKTWISSRTLSGNNKPLVLVTEVVRRRLLLPRYGDEAIIRAVPWTRSRFLRLLNAFRPHPVVPLHLLLA
jgi:hypothetical protein